MMGSLKESNVNGGRSLFEKLVTASSADAVKANGFAVDVETGSSSGLGCDGLVTYKRRRTVKGVERQPSDKKAADYSNDCSLKHKRNIILEQMCQSLDSGGLKECIQSALVFPAGSGSGTTVKESVRSCEDWSKSTSQSGTLLDGLQNGTKDSDGLSASGTVNEPNSTTFTERCSCTFYDIIMSEHFTQLCGLLLENFGGTKADKLFELNHINTRMKEKAYENSPLLFQSDIQEIWVKLQKVGSDITALGKRLSEKTATSFREQCPQVGKPAHSISEGAKNEFITQESDMRTKLELTETCALDEAHTCRHCREKADGGNGLVCDSCEEIYHISCVEPAVKEIPTRSWYCANCTAKGIESSHENCIACERLHAYISSLDGSGGENELENEGTAEELEESSNELSANEVDRRFQHCSVCKTEVSSDEDYRICGHPYCPHKFYHANCLTAKQLNSHGPCWYCPSCLCRACLIDKDDSKIVLCDGCDHGYHLYCMHPPRTIIPKGKWFCQKCDSGIQRIQRARMSHEKMQNAMKKKALDGKGSEALNKSGGMDMLLNAAKTLNYEENLAAMGIDS